jgi:hypothetical protein
MTRIGSLLFKKDARKRESKLLQISIRLRNRLIDLIEMMARKCLALPLKRLQSKAMKI